MVPPFLLARHYTSPSSRLPRLRRAVLELCEKALAPLTQRAHTGLPHTWQERVGQLSPPTERVRLMPMSCYYDAAGYPLFPCGSNPKVFSPTDLNRLQAIFDDCLRECSFTIDSEAAEALGCAIIRLYSQGQQDPIFIKAALLPSFKRRQ
jgi:hypothetical protein